MNVLYKQKLPTVEVTEWEGRGDSHPLLTWDDVNWETLGWDPNGDHAECERPISEHAIVAWAEGKRGAGTLVCPGSKIAEFSDGRIDTITGDELDRDWDLVPK
jgi:hypothetical protein